MKLFESLFIYFSVFFCNENIIYFRKRENVTIGELNYDDILLNYIYTPIGKKEAKI
jgi:hypothetical protein